MIMLFNAWTCKIIYRFIELTFHNLIGNLILTDYCNDNYVGSGYIYLAQRFFFIQMPSNWDANDTSDRQDSFG